MYLKHGRSHTRLYAIWNGMRQRCYNPKTDHFDRYGGRGITICEEWRDNFEAFEAWALSHGYNKGLTIDRIDVDGNYAPSNCRWVSQTEQLLNRTCTRWATINGETHTIQEWAVISGININTLCARYDRGDRGERLIRQRNARSNARIVTINGESHLLDKWAEITGINYSTLCSRYDRGDRGERLIRKRSKSK